MAVTHGRLRISADPAWGWCAGLRHPPQAEYPAGAFTPVQLDQLRADPALTVEELGEVEATSSLAATTGNPSPADGAATAGDVEGVAGTNAEEEAGAALNSTQARADDAAAPAADEPAAASAPAQRARKAR